MSEEAKEETQAVMSEQEEKIKNMYGQLPKKPSLASKRLMGGKPSRFDSADWMMNKGEKQPPANKGSALGRKG